MKRLLILPLVFLLVIGGASAFWTPDWNIHFPNFGTMFDCSAINCADYVNNSCQQFVTAAFPTCCEISNKPVGTDCGMMMKCTAAGTCEFFIPTPTPCNDNNPCTVNDMNSIGMCMGSPVATGTACPGGTCNAQAQCVPLVPVCFPIPESCNGFDDDCDGQVDEGLTAPLSAYQQGVCAGSLKLCMGAGGWFSVPPASQESCNGLDDDCDGEIDEGLLVLTYHADMDGDGWGDPDSIMIDACSIPTGYVNNGADCNDSNILVHHNATELCNGLDDNCDGTIDEGCSAPIVCGDNEVQGTEECDDGNTNNHDGCSFTCLVEAEWMCTGNPSNCTRVEPECTGNTIIGGTIYKENVTNGIVGASVEVICSHNGNDYTQTTTSISKGQYSVTFPCVECDYTDGVVVNAEKDALAGTNDGSVSMIYPGLTLNVGIVNVDLIPEFGLIAGGIALIGALGIFMYRRH